MSTSKVTKNPTHSNAASDRREFTHEELSSAFTKLYNEYKNIIYWSIKKYTDIDERRCGRSTVEEYAQETSIYIWTYFQTYYSGPVSPCYPSGEPSTWEAWFFSYAKFGARNTYRKLNPNGMRNFWTNSFSQMPDWYDPADNGIEYDFEKEEKILKMEKAIATMPAEKKIKVECLLNNNNSFKHVFAARGLPDNNATRVDLKWIVVILGHITKRETNFQSAFRFADMKFEEALDYIVELRTPCLINPTLRTAFETAHKIIKENTPRDLLEKRVSGYTKADCDRLISELRRVKFHNGEAPIIFHRRIRDLFNYMKDLELIDCNPIPVTKGMLRKRENQARRRSLNKIRKESKAVAPIQKKPLPDFWTLKSFKNIPDQPVDLLDKNGKLISSFSSITVAVKELRKIGIKSNPSDIKGCCIGSRVSSYGYKWRWSGVPKETRTLKPASYACAG